MPISSGTPRRSGPGPSPRQIFRTLSMLEEQVPAVARSTRRSRSSGTRCAKASANASPPIFEMRAREVRETSNSCCPPKRSRHSRLPDGDVEASSLVEAAGGGRSRDAARSRRHLGRPFDGGRAPESSPVGPFPPTIRLGDRQDRPDGTATGTADDGGIRRMTAKPIEVQRAGLSAAVDRLSIHSTEWSCGRVLDEGLDLIARTARGRTPRCSTRSHPTACSSCAADRRRRRPCPTSCRSTGSPGPRSAQPPALPARRGRRSAAGLTGLRPDPRRSGVRSCLHLPILERSAPVGAVHLYWTEPRSQLGRPTRPLLRTLGRFLLARASA